MGWILVLLDVVFVVASAVAFVMVIVLLRAIAGDGNATTGNDAVLGEGNERSVDRRPPPQSTTKVVPAQQQQRSTLQNEIAALKWQKNIRQTLMNNNKPSKMSRVPRRTQRKQTWRTQRAEEIQKNHQNHRELALKNIERQQSQRRSSLQLRLQARNNKKESSKSS